MKQFLLENKLIIAFVTVMILLTTIGLSYAFMPSDVVVTSEGNSNMQLVTGSNYELKNIRNSEKLVKSEETNYTLLEMQSDVILTASASVTTKYDIYYDIKVNKYLGGTTTPTAKVIAKIFNPSGNEITSLTGLTRVTVGSITGFDLTDYTGSILLSENHSIATSSSITQNWQVKVYLYDTAGLSNISNTIFDSELNLSDPCWIPKTSADLILCDNGGKSYIEAKAEPDFTQVANTNEGMFAAPDTYGTAYYYRGAVDNNWLYYNGIYWRIVSVAGNGSLKLLYSGTTAPTESQAIVMTGSGTQIGTSKFNSISNDNAYVGYMYTVGEKQGLETKSTIAATLDNWYTINMNGVNSQIADNIFCYDRNLTTSGYQTYSFGWDGSTYTGTGEGTSFTLYGTAARITASSVSLTAGGTGPELVCPSKVDAYTVDDSINGNGELSEKVGLLTADEAVMAGLAPIASNSANYLYTNSGYWFGSPFGFYAAGYAAEWFLQSSGVMTYISVGNPYGVRPVVYLSSNIELSGTGEWNDVYKIK